MTRQQSIEKADALLEKYYDGTSTKADESWLQDFLQQENLPERFDADRAFFGYVRIERLQETEPHTAFIAPDTTWESNTVEPSPKPPRGLLLSFHPAWKTILVAAAFIAAVFIPGYIIQAKNQDVAYVNGVKFTNQKDLRHLALNSIQSLNDDDVENTIQGLNEENPLETQLEHFPAIE